MDRKLVYRDHGGVRRTLVTNVEEGSVGVLTEMDIDRLITENQALEEEHVAFSDNKIVARIPMVVYEKLMLDGTIADDERFKRWLNDPDNRVFRVWRGNL